MPWPTPAELEAFMVQSGLTTVGAVPEAFYQAQIDSAVAEWEHVVGVSPWIAETQTRKYTPDETEYIFISGSAVRSISTISIDGTTLVEDTDFWLMGQSAPYFYIKLAAPWCGKPKAFTVTGSFGYATDVSADVYNAVLHRASSKVRLTLPGYASSIAAGDVIGERQGEVEYRYASIQDYEAYGLGVLSQYDRVFFSTAERYRRVDVA